MKLKWFAIVLMLFPLCQAWAQEPAAAAGPAAATPETGLQSQKEKVSYGIGVEAGRNFKRNELDIDLELVIKGLKDGYSGGQLLVSEEEFRKAMTAYQRELAAKKAEALKLAADKNKKEGDAFLEENKKKEGVVTLESGLQYKILTAGTGNLPTDKDMVEVNYRGTLIDGTEFDSSYKRGQPASFQLARIIPGWKEALKLMPAGSKWQIFIPPALAYGTRGSGDKIGPNATLIFEVELLSVKEAPAQPEKKPVATPPVPAPAPKN